MLCVVSNTVVLALDGIIPFICRNNSWWQFSFQCISIGENFSSLSRFKSDKINSLIIVYEDHYLSNF